MTPSIPSDTVTIQLTKDFVAFVSPEDADLGELKWFVASKKAGQYFVAVREIWPNGKRKHLYLHRIILERMLGRTLSRFELCDHADGNTLNDTRENLRLATPSQNTMNSKKRINKKHPFKGVDRHTQQNKWRARITIEGKTEHLGLFDTPEEAYEAYCQAALKHHGKFARYE